MFNLIKWTIARRFDTRPCHCHVISVNAACVADVFRTVDGRTYVPVDNRNS